MGDGGWGTLISFPNPVWERDGYFLMGMALFLGCTKIRHVNDLKMNLHFRNHLDKQMT